MSIGQHCEVLKLKTYLLALTGQVRMNCGSLASPSTKTIIPSSSLTRFRWSRPSEAPGFPTELVLVQMLAVVSWFDHCSASDDSINWNQHETNGESWMSSVFLQRWGPDPSHVPQNTPKVLAGQTLTFPNGSTCKFPMGWTQPLQGSPTEIAYPVPHWLKVAMRLALESDFQCHCWADLLKIKGEFGHCYSMNMI